MTSDEAGSVSRLLGDLGGSEADRTRAQEELWNRYFTRLSSLARQRMPTGDRRASDEEDVALSALNSFFRRAGDGEFPHLHDRNALWPLLARIACFKAIQRIEYEHAQKRGGGKVVRESELQSEGGDLPTLDHVFLSTEPTPDFAVLIDEQVQHMLGRLQDDELRRMAQLKLEGYGNQEIAETLGRGLRTIERKFKLIRSIWSDAALSNDLSD